MKSMADKSVDLIICDLPFGCLTGGGGQEKSKRINNANLKLNHIKNGVVTGKRANTQDGLLSGCPWDIKIDLEEFWTQVKRIRKNDHTPCIHFCTTKYGFDLYNSNPKEFRYDLVWSKGRGVSFLTANKMPMRSHEMIYVFSKTGANYNRIDITGDFKNSQGGGSKSNVYGVEGYKGNNNEGKRCALSVIRNTTIASKGNHPTQKPLDLYKFLIERYSNEGDTVLDPTFGSCNSGLACKELKRKYIGCEMNEEFYKKGVEKMAGPAV
jgi:site-specific DNA-methyltransferase (adenine-specific)